MKRLISIFTVALLLVGVVLIGGLADNTAVVSWNSGDGCWIELIVHADVDLGTISLGQPLTSTGNTITVNSNCENGITLTVEPTAVLDPHVPLGGSTSDGILPNSASVFDDFKWKTSDASTYTPFSSLGDEQTVATTSNPANLSVDIDYQYMPDNNDVPGDYSVTLLYTVTANAQ